MQAARQTAALDDLLHRAEQIPEVQALILIGSLASNTADTMSDVDAIALVDESSFDAAHQRRHALHAAEVPACWDKITNPASDVAAHKWIDDRGVLVEVLLGTISSLRIAEPAKVVLGDPAILTRAHRRPPIAREEMTQNVHPIEAAYDNLKNSVRHASRRT